MPTRDDRPNWSEQLPERGPEDLGPESDEEGPLCAFYMATVRVEVDPRSQEVSRVPVVDRKRSNPGPRSG